MTAIVSKATKTEPLFRTDPARGSFWDWLARVGRASSAGKQADLFARLNAMSDAELAERGLARQDLAYHCFGARAYL